MKADDPQHQGQDERVEPQSSPSAPPPPLRAEPFPPYEEYEEYGTYEEHGTFGRPAPPPPMPPPTQAAHTPPPGPPTPGPADPTRPPFPVDLPAGSAPPPMMSPANHADLDDCCPSCRAEYPSLIRRLLRRGGTHAPGCPFRPLPLRLVAGLDERQALLLLADQQAGRTGDDH